MLHTIHDNPKQLLDLVGRLGFEALYLEHANDVLQKVEAGVKGGKLVRTGSVDSNNHVWHFFAVISWVSNGVDAALFTYTPIFVSSTETDMCQDIILDTYNKLLKECLKTLH